ncbi:MAG: glycosyltransferase family 4 protein [Gemmatimonadaceae bacterium]
MTKPKLTFVVESGTDVRLVEGLAERFELTILGRPISNGVIISQRSMASFELVTGPASRWQFGRFVRRELLTRSPRADLIVVQGYGIAALASNLAARKTGKRCTMLVCSPAEEYYLQRKAHPFPDKPFRRRELAALRAIARINGKVGQQYCVLSHHLENTVRAHQTRLPVGVIPVYGVDTSRFHPSSEGKRVLRERVGLPLEEPVLFFSSRVAPEKDGEALLKAVLMLRQFGRRMTVLHRSGGHLDFMRLAREVGVADQVIATDAVPPGEDLARDYQASDICVQASRAEGLGFSALEALACETPVIASLTGGLKETIVNGVTGFTYPVGDSRALADCIAYNLDHPQEAMDTAREGRRMVIERFEAKTVFDAFQKLVASDASAPPVVPSVG